MQEIVSIILEDGNFEAIKDRHVLDRAPQLERTPVKHASQVSVIKIILDQPSSYQGGGYLPLKNFPCHPRTKKEVT